ncbi:hypothetical protein ACFQ6Q_34060, partial [Streptomyces sp. NPDC056437]|uniref:hypothetical protein n=1 Tax=Streptomyces sp. NPDC056437 TaxID=3345816 RepID=UPI00368A6E33
MLVDPFAIAGRGREQSPPREPVAGHALRRRAGAFRRLGWENKGNTSGLEIWTLTRRDRFRAAQGVRTPL